MTSQRMVLYDGVEQPFTSLLKSKGLYNHANTIRIRIKTGWRPQRAIDTPIRTGNYKRKEI